MRYNDPLMWPHYAGSYSGVCLVYSFPHLVQAGPWFALQVMYVEEAPTSSGIRQSLRLLAATPAYNDPLAQIEHAQLHFGIKLSAWSHEQELRLCSPKSQAKHPYPRSALVGVILGPSVSFEAEASVRRAATEGREQVTIESLTVDSDRNILLVPGLENDNVELRVSSLRNLVRKMKHGKAPSR